MHKHTYLPILLSVVLIVGTGCSTQTKPTNTATPQTTTNQAAAVQPALKNPNLSKIMENVKAQFPTVQETKIFDETNDPYGNLSKAGFYTAGAAFWDTRTNYSEEYTDQKGKWGADAGGSIEAYASNADAKNRVDYMSQFNGNAMFNPGEFKQIDNLVIRASSKLSKSQEDEIIQFLENQVQQYN